MRYSVSSGTPLLVRAEMGKISTAPLSKRFANAAAFLMAANTCSWGRRSILLMATITSSGMAAISRASPGPPTPLDASTTKTVASVSSLASVAVRFRRFPMAVLGLCTPGVSTNTSWASARVSMPRISWRVVWGRGDTIVTF